MKTSSIYTIFLSLFIMIACGKQEKKPETVTAKKNDIEIKDGMIYGLACEGCNDTFVVMIPTDNLEGKPMKLNVLHAFKKRKVIGKLEPGDWCAVMLNEKDKTVADIVINMDLIKGKWVHQVMPEEKENARAMIMLEDPDANVDSIIQSYMQPVERGFQLMRRGRAATVGTNFLGNDDNPYVSYPAGSNYASWKVAFGQIIFSEADSIIDPNDPNMLRKIANTSCERDTCDLVMLLKDSLQISYKGKISSYYRAQ